MADNFVSKTLDTKTFDSTTFDFNKLNTPGRKEWPELMGKNIDEAKNILAQDERKLRIEILDHNSSYNELYCYTRVRLFHKNGIITQIPVIR